MTSRIPATAKVIDFESVLIERREQSRAEFADIQAGKHFDDVTERQRIAFLAATSAAERDHGHGSQAHCAAIDLAKRQWAADTKDAKVLYDETLIWFLTHDELSTELDDRWTELLDRERVMEAMSEAAE